VHLEEGCQKLAVGDLRRVEVNLDGFRVPCSPAADVFVRGISGRPTGVANRCRSNAFQLPEGVLNSPKAPCCKFSLSNKQLLEKFQNRDLEGAVPRPLT
jgi:hypothetical protein